MALGSETNSLPSFHYRLNAKAPLSKPVSLGSADTLKLSLTAKDNGKGKRPHQAFLILQEPESGVEAPFPFTVKENGKAVAQLVSQSIGNCPAAHVR